MSKQALVYIAYDSQDSKIVDILLAHLNHAGIKCIWRKHVKQMMNEASDIEGTMDDADTIIVVDSHAFRQHEPNYELKYAQSLNKPLIVLSLNQILDEERSSRTIRLFNFQQPQHEDWQRLLVAIVDVTKEATKEPHFGFLI